MILVGRETASLRLTDLRCAYDGLHKPFTSQKWSVQREGHPTLLPVLVFQSPKLDRSKERIYLLLCMMETPWLYRL
jgi:hypothetical protein